MSQNIKLKQWKFTRYIRYLKYSSLKKICNLLISILYWYTGKVTITTKPAFLRVEISRKCTVNCLYCTEKKEEIFYPYDLYKSLIDKLKEYIFLVSLYEIGEPLENEKIIDFIKYAKVNKIGTIISTSLSIKKSELFWEDLVLSGLDRMVVSIDGISENVYNRYRTNGNLDLVLSNLDKILYYKKKHSAKTIVEWQMIDFPWNKIEQKQSKLIALRKGCDEFRIIQEAAKIRQNYKNSAFIRNRNCILPYFTFNVNAYNKVRSCTKIYSDPMIIGDLNSSCFQDIWNGSAISEIRSKEMIQFRVGCNTCCE